jgi:hypothetical protein
MAYLTFVYAIACFARTSSAYRTMHVAMHIVTFQAFSFPTDIALLLRNAFCADSLSAFAVQHSPIPAVTAECFSTVFTGVDRTAASTKGIIAMRALNEFEWCSLVTLFATRISTRSASSHLAAIQAKFITTQSAFVRI